MFTQLFRERLLISHFFSKPADCSFIWTLVLRVMANKAVVKVFTDWGRQRSDSSWRNTWGWFHKVGRVTSTVADESFCWCETAELPSLSRTRESISHILQQHHPHSPLHCQIYASHRRCTSQKTVSALSLNSLGRMEGRWLEFWRDGYQWQRWGGGERRRRLAVSHAQKKLFILELKIRGKAQQIIHTDLQLHSVERIPPPTPNRLCFI